MTPRRSAAATAHTSASTRRHPTASQSSRSPSGPFTAAVNGNGLGRVRVVVVASNLPLSSSVRRSSVLAGSPDPRQHPFGSGQPPLSGRLSGRRWRRSQHHGARFPVAFRPPAFASRIILRPPRRSAFLTVSPPDVNHAWTPTGLSRSARDRYDRGGCPLYPGDGGALPPGQVPPGGTCRLTTTGPYLPLKHPIEREC